MRVFQGKSIFKMQHFFQPRQGHNVLGRGNAPLMATPRLSSPVRGEMIFIDWSIYFAPDGALHQLDAIRTGCAHP